MMGRALRCREPQRAHRTLHSVSDTDEAAWTEVLSGRGEAFGAVFDRHRARIHRHSRGLVPSPSDADDVVAVTFLEAWRKRDRVAFVDGSMLPWLLRTATFTAANLTRASRRYGAALRRLPVNEMQIDHAERIDDGDAVAALRSLAPTDQTVITLCVLEGLATPDAARVMGVREGTVKSRLSRAKARLRRALGDHPTPFSRPEGATDAS
jgi:RNA polymerase sigma factor (sigma-70 family)